MGAMDNRRSATQYYVCWVVDFYNDCRPHRSLGLRPPNGRSEIESWTGAESIVVTRRDRLGGLLHEYQRAA